MRFNPSIFKAYDIRGIYDIDFDDSFAYQLGLAYSQLRSHELGHSDITIVAGRDMRLSSESLQAELIRGLKAGGATVIDVGLVPTPSFYFSVAHYKYDGGIMVSASHNPSEYNGFKMVREMASPIGLDSGLNDLKKLLLETTLTPSDQPGKIINKLDVITDQVQLDLSFIKIEKIKPFKIVIDTANAMGSVYFDEILKKLPQLHVEKMNWELDGTFPVHEADPYKLENVRELGKRVVSSGADLGIATDGDADRIFFIDNVGKPVEPGIMRAILAKLFLRTKPGTTIAYDIRPGRITRETIITEGGEPLVTRVGHSLIKEAMIDTGAYFGGESSGHFFLNMEKEGCYEVPGIVMLKLLAELSDTEQTLAEYGKPYQKYVHSGEISIPIKSGETVLTALEKQYQDGKQSTLDGLTVEYPDFWFNVRLSNTEPLIRLNLEGISKDIVQEKTKEILDFLKNKSSKS